MSKIVREFREFIARGSVIDLAVGIIIGAAFGKIVNSLVNDILMPPIGLVLSDVNFSDLFFTLKGHYNTIDDARKAGAPIIAYGSFLSTVIEFLIVAACVFALVKVVNRFKRAEAAAVPPPTRSEQLLEEIRDLLQRERRGTAADSRLSPDST
jgi:large conductance mechanosensitive channel